MKYTVRLADMPPSIRSFVKKEMDYHTIVINSRLSHDMQRQCFIHEMLHILNDDMGSNDSADMIELHSHKNTALLQQGGVRRK